MIRTTGILLMLFFLALTATGFAQEKENQKKKKYKEKGLFIGGNIGFYFANKYTANYYNGIQHTDIGWGTDSNNIERIIYHPYFYPKIRDTLGGHDFYLGELPAKMHYQPAWSVGVFLKYTFKKNFGIYFQFNYAKINLSDVFTLIVDEYNNGFTDPYYEMCTLNGTEERINVDFGIRKLYNPKGAVHPYLEAGINLNDTKPLSSTISIKNLTYNISNPYYAYYKIPEGGLGYGIQTGMGLHIPVNDKFVTEFGAMGYLSRINLGEEKRFRPQFNFYFRLLLTNIGI